MKLEAILQKLGLLQPGKIMYIGGSDVLPAPLKPEQERQAVAALEQGDEAAKQLLIEHNLRLVVYIARRFENTGVNLEDLISIGTIGLIKAVNTFRPDRNIKLATYSSRCIENEILMHIRKIANQKTEVSLDEPINTDWDGNELLLSDVLGTDGDIVMRPLEDDVDHQLLRQALGRLPEREKQIVSMRFGLGGRQEKTQKEVADIMGISQSYISRLESASCCACAARSHGRSTAERDLQNRFKCDINLSIQYIDISKEAVSWRKKYPAQRLSACRPIWPI